MEIRKKCRNCGKPFEGRSNQLHCSHKCKSEFFQRNEENKPKTEAPPTLNEVDTKTALELRRLELQYQKDMEILRAEEREKERLLEWQKEQEKTARFKEHLLFQEKQKATSTPQNRYQENEEADEGEAYELPKHLQKSFERAMQKVIDLYDTNTKVLDVKTLKSTLESLLESLDKFEVKEGFEEEEHTYEYELVSDTLDEITEWLKPNYSVMTVQYFSIDEELYDNLVEYLEDDEE